MRRNPTGHPARFSPEIVTAIIDILVEELTRTGVRHLHDPFAGTGEALAEIVDRLDLSVSASGTEIEPEWIVNEHIVMEGDATDASTYPDVPYCIVTSPVYPNGMADSWLATDETKRNTYRHRLRRLNGFDRELHENDMGRYGYRGRGPNSKNRQMYWNLAERSVLNWDDAVFCVVNVSDFMFTRERVEHVEPVVNGWASLLRSHGWTEQIRVPVGTRRNGEGANREKRVDNEEIILAKKGTPT